MGKHFIALRIRPLKKWADVAAATEHGQRIRNVAHVDASRSSLNVHWSHDPAVGGLAPVDAPAEIATCLRKRADQLGARWHKTAIVATEILFIASPGFFLSDSGTNGHTGPARPTTEARCAATASGAVASTDANSARPPAATISAATASSGPMFRAARKTCAPSRANAFATAAPTAPEAP